MKIWKNKDITKLIKYYNENKDETSLEIKELIPSVFKNIEEYKKFMYKFCLANSINNSKFNNYDMIGIYVNYLKIIDEIINSWYERVFEHFTLYYPEASIKTTNLDKFLTIKKFDRKSLSKEFEVDINTIGADLEKIDIELLQNGISTLKELVNQKKELETRLIKITEELAFNTSKIAGAIVTAKLIAAAGSLKKLMLMPSSTIQVMGAEKALFRHLKSKKSKSPKHGIIFQSEFVSGAPGKHRGKMARALASKISICAKVDYYKGESIWEKVVKQLQNKLEGLK